MLLDLTTKANPVFLSGNFLTRHADQAGDLAVSSGVDLRHRLYDMSPAAMWAGETASDAANETIIAGLWLPGMQSEQDVDFLAALGHNLLAFDWDLSDDNGATYPGANQQVKTALATDYSITSLTNAIPADKFKLTAHTTQTADQFKQIGAIVVAAVQMQLSVGLSLFKRHPYRTADRSAKMHDKSTRRTHIGRSDGAIFFTDFSVGVSGLAEAEADALEAILMGRDPFIFYPEPGRRPGNMYLGQALPGTVTRNHLALSTSGGEVVTFDFEEAGGA